MSVFDAYQAATGAKPATPAAPVTPAPAPSLLQKAEGFVGGVVNDVKSMFGGAPAAPAAPAKTPAPVVPAAAPAAPKSVFDEYQAATGKAPTPSVAPATPSNGQQTPVPPADPSAPAGPDKGMQVSPYFAAVDSKGNSFGFSDQLDTSGVPYFAYRAPGDTSTTTDLTRVAVSGFDPRVAQPLKASEFLTPRAVANRATLKTQMGGNYSDELDHIISLELAGSNNKANLQIEPDVPGTNNTATDPLENTLAKNVVTGKMSLFQAQTALAQAKGKPAPFSGAAPKTSSFLGDVGKDFNAIKNTYGDLAKKVGGVFADFLGTPEGKSTEGGQAGEIDGDLKTTPGTGAIGGYQAAAAQAPTKSLNPQDWLKAGADNLVSTIKDSADKLSTFNETYDNPNSTKLQKFTTAGEAGLGIINGVFTIFSAPLAAMSKIPVIGQVADKVNELFNALGQGASNVAVNDIVNKLPVTEATKVQLRPVVGDIAALAAQIGAGEAAGHGGVEAKGEGIPATEAKGTPAADVQPKQSVKVAQLVAKTKELATHLTNNLTPDKLAEAGQEQTKGATEPSHADQVVEAHKANIEAAQTARTPLPADHPANVQLPEALAKYHLEDMGKPKQGLANISEARHLITTLEGELKSAHPSADLRTDAQNTMQTHLDALKQYVTENKSYERYWTGKVEGDTISRAERAASDPTANQSAKYVERYSGDVLDAIQKGNDVPKEVIDQRPEFGDAAAEKDNEDMQREAAFGTLHESSSFKEGSVGDRYDLPVTDVHQAVRNIFPDPKEVDFLFPNELLHDEGYKLHGRYTPERAFKNPLIEAVQKDGKISSHTLYHEAFHHFFKNFLSEDEQKELIKNVKRNPLSIAERSKAAIRSRSYKTADVRAEEFLANDFAKWMREKTGIKENTTLYEKIKAKVQQFVRKITGLKDVYEKIANGDRSYRKPSRLFTGKEAWVPSFEEDTDPDSKVIGDNDKTETPESRLEGLKVMKEIYEEQLDIHPAKDLQKYVSKTTGRLPEVTGKDTMKSLTGNGKDVKTSEFGRTGDQIVQELGYTDVDHATQAHESYQEMRGQLKDLNKQIADTKAEIRENKTAKNLAQVKKASQLGPPIEGDFDANGKLTPQARAERKANLRKYGDLESAKKLGDLHQDYHAYRADVLKRGGQGVFAKPPLDKAGRVLGRSDMPTVIDGLRQAYHGEIETGPRKFRGMAPEAKDWFQNFVYRRRNVGIEARSTLSGLKTLIGSGEFDRLTNEGLQGMHDYDGVPMRDQEGKLMYDERGNQRFSVPPKRTGAFGKLADLYKHLYDQEVAAGIQVGEKQNYQPIYVEKTGEQINAQDLRREQMAPGKHIGLRPDFTLSRDFDSYAEAMKAGKKPAFTNLFDVLNERLEQHYKAMANAQMWNEGVRSGYIVPSEMVKANKDLLAKEYPGGAFSSYDPDRVPSRSTGYTSRDTSVEHVNSQGWMGPKPIVDLLNGYLKEPETTFEKGLRATARFAGTARNLVLGVGIPKTALTVHYFNMLPRDLAADAFSGEGRVKEFGRTLGWTLKPSEAAKFIDANLEKAMPLYRAGMLFSSSDYHAPDLDEHASTVEKLGAKYTAASHAWHNWFGGNFFESFLPARMMQNGMRLADKYKAEGIEEGAAYKRAADEMNYIYGNVDSAALGRDKNLQNLLRSVVLAPSFLENSGRVGGKMFRGVAEDLHLKKPIEPGTKQYALYAKYAYFVLGAYAVGNLLNYENSGKWMYQNDPLHQFDINFGTDSKGKTRYVGIVGTGADMVRLPMEIAAAIAQGKPQDITTSIRDRASTVVGPALSLITNSDWSGDPIIGPDKYGKPQSAGTQVGNIFDNTVGSELPGQVTTGQQYLAGQISGEQAATGIAGAPFHYKNEQPNATTLNAAVANTPAAQARAAIVPIYQKITKQGLTDPAGAQQAYDALTDAQKAVYQKYKSGQKSKATVAAEAKLLATYQKAQGLAQSGDTAGAQALYDALSPSDQHAYQLLKARFQPTK